MMPFEPTHWNLTSVATRRVRWLPWLLAIWCGLDMGYPSLLRGEPADAPVGGKEPGSASEFLRFVKSGPGEGKVDTALKTYTRRRDGVRVALVAVVHIGDAGYYDRLQKAFESYDTVLYEMIREGGAEAPTEPGTAHPISQLQIGMKKLLELEFQLDRIDYHRANFVHADLDPDAFAKLQEERGESILGLLFKAAMEEQRRQSADPSKGINPFAMLAALMSRDRGHQLKFILGQQMGEMENLLAGIDQSEDGKGSAILSGRNEHVIKVLLDQIAKGRRKLAIFYGAGHMPDLEKRLATLDFAPTTTEWHTAWDIRRKRLIEGWDVRVHPGLLTNEPAATARALELLRAQLAEIGKQVPPASLARLRQVTLWFSPAYPGSPPTAEYHPDAGWLRQHGRDPGMAKAIEFTNIPQFEAETRRMPVFVLHELAHAYHDRVLGFNHLEIRANFEAAKRSGRYDSVKRWTGERETRDRAYALTDAKEYFAETSEAFFGRNDFEPFTREELKSFDPDQFKLLEKLWGVRTD